MTAGLCRPSPDEVAATRRPVVGLCRPAKVPHLQIGVRLGHSLSALSACSSAPGHAWLISSTVGAAEDHREVVARREAGVEGRAASVEPDSASLPTLEVAFLPENGRPATGCDDSETCNSGAFLIQISRRARRARRESMRGRAHRVTWAGPEHVARLADGERPAGAGRAQLLSRAFPGRCVAATISVPRGDNRCTLRRRRVSCGGSC